MLGSGDQRQNAMLMIRLAWSCPLQHDSARYSAGYEPKLDPSFVLWELKGNGLGTDCRGINSAVDGMGVTIVRFAKAWPGASRPRERVAARTCSSRENCVLLRSI